MNKEERFFLAIKPWKDCQLCPLAKTSRKGLIMAEGTPFTDILFIGEWAKNQTREVEGRVFTAEEFDLFNAMLEQFRLSPDEIMTVPMLACRPSDVVGTTVRPQTAWVKTCKARVDAIIEAIDPLVLVLIGQQAYTMYGKNHTNKKTYANLTNTPSLFESILIGKSGVEVRRSAVVIRPLDWLLEKNNQKLISKTMEALGLAIAALDHHNHYLKGENYPVRRDQ